MVPRLLRPLRRRDYALYISGAAISYVGDGVLTVALAFQVYRLSNLPSALSFVLLAWTVPVLLLVLAGGVASDRLDRRVVMVSADLMRFAIMAVTGFLSVSGDLRLWHLIALATLSGIGTAFFYPASGALLPDLVPAEELAQANGLYGAMWPLTFMMLGPALGGLMVGIAGPGPAMLFDALTFLASAGCVFSIRRRPSAPEQKTSAASFKELTAGLRFVVQNRWCGASLLGYGVGLLGTRGPTQVLVPFLVKNELHSGAQAFGFIVGAGGVGAVLASFLGGQLGLPRRAVLVMSAAWAFSFVGVVLYAAMSSIWQGIGIAFAIGAAHSFGLVIWFTMLQTRVPRSMLGRVSSVDWLLSFSLLPLSLVLVGPLAGAWGARTTFLIGGGLGGVGMIAMLMFPSMWQPSSASQALEV